MTCGGRALVCAMLQEANWSRSSSCWDMSRFKRPSDTLAASSGFGRRSMIASESNQIAESPGRSGRVADNTDTTPSMSDSACTHQSTLRACSSTWRGVIWLSHASLNHNATLFVSERPHSHCVLRLGMKGLLQSSPSRVSEVLLIATLSARLSCFLASQNCPANFDPTALVSACGVGAVLRIHRSRAVYGCFSGGRTGKPDGTLAVPRGR